MKKFLILTLSAATLLLAACNKDEEKTAPIENEVAAAPAEETETAASQTSADPDEQMIYDIFEKNQFLLVDLDELDISQDAGSKKKDDKVMSIHLSFNAPNSAENARIEIEKYTMYLAADIYKQRPEISKLNVFWQAPELKDDWNVVKINFVRDDKRQDMIVKSTYFDGSVF